MKFFKRKKPLVVPSSDTPVFARLAVEMPLPAWDDVEQVAA